MNEWLEKARTEFLASFFLECKTCGERVNFLPQAQDLLWERVEEKDGKYTMKVSTKSKYGILRCHQGQHTIARAP